MAYNTSTDTYTDYSTQLHEQLGWDYVTAIATLPDGRLTLGGVVLDAQLNKTPKMATFEPAAIKFTDISAGLGLTNIIKTIEIGQKNGVVTTYLGMYNEDKKTYKIAAYTAGPTPTPVLVRIKTLEGCTNLDEMFIKDGKDLFVTRRNRDGAKVEEYKNANIAGYTYVDLTNAFNAALRWPSVTA